MGIQRGKQPSEVSAGDRLSAREYNLIVRAVKSILGFSSGRGSSGPSAAAAGRQITRRPATPMRRTKDHGDGTYDMHEVRLRSDGNGWEDVVGGLILEKASSSVDKIDAEAREKAQVSGLSVDNSSSGAADVSGVHVSFVFRTTDGDGDREWVFESPRKKMQASFFEADNTFTVPDGVDQLEVIAIGGGGGGGGGNNNAGSLTTLTDSNGDTIDLSAGAGSGASGGNGVWALVNVTPGENVTITIGSGGSGGTGSNSGTPSDGSNGSNTDVSFGSASATVIAEGGSKGLSNPNSTGVQGGIPTTNGGSISGNDLVEGFLATAEKGGFSETALNAIAEPGVGGGAAFFGAAEGTAVLGTSDLGRGGDGGQDGADGENGVKGFVLLRWIE